VRESLIFRHAKCKMLQLWSLTKLIRKPESETHVRFVSLWSAGLCVHHAPLPEIAYSHNWQNDWYAELNFLQARKHFLLESTKIRRHLLLMASEAKCDWDHDMLCLPFSWVGVIRRKTGWCSKSWWSTRVATNNYCRLISKLCFRHILTTLNFLFLHEFLL
jgi:hypothetical protein